MAPRGGGKSPKKKKKQISINAYTSKASSRGSNNKKSKKNNTTNNSDDGLPTSRTWIYHTPSTSTTQTLPQPPTLNNSDRPVRKAAAAALVDETKKNKGGIKSTNDDDDGGYELYLNKRVQRPIVRSLPCSYSFFRNNNDGEEECTASTTVADTNSSNGDAALKTEGEEGGNNVKRDTNSSIDNYDDKVIQPNNINYTYVPLPPEEQLNPPNDASTQQQQQQQSSKSTSISSLSYSKFTSSTKEKDTRLTKFQFSLNYNTHVPNKNIVSYVGGTNQFTDRTKDSGYVLQLPLVEGTVIGYSPPLIDTTNDVVDDEEGGGGNNNEEGEFPIDRMKEDEPLFRILWDGHSSSSTTTATTNAAVGYIEDVTLPELLSCLLECDLPSELSTRQRMLHKKTLVGPYDLSSPSSSVVAGNDNNDTPVVVLPPQLLSQTSHCITKHVHATTCRKQLAMEWKLEYDILPHLVTLAALELRKELSNKVRMEILLERKRLREVSGLDGTKKKKKRGGGNDDDEEEDVLNAKGDKFGYYTRHPNQYMSSFQPPPPLPSDDIDDDSDDGSDNEEGGGTKQQSKSSSRTKLSKDELIAYQTKLAEQCNIPPSKIAERVKIACTLAYDYAKKNGLLDEYYAECNTRKERERIEKERMAEDVAGYAGRGASGGGRNTPSGGMDTGIGSGEVRRSSRARTVVNYADDGTPAASAVEDILNDHEGKKSSNTGAASLPLKLSIGGPTALCLLEMLGMLPDKKDDDDEGAALGETANDGDDDDEEEMDVDDEEEEEEEEEVKESDNDPFFEPNPCLIIDQLGRKHRYLSPASIQQSIVRGIEAHQIDTPQSLLDEEEVNDGHAYVTDLVCTTGDKVSDLGQFEPSSFARCRFAPRTFIPETDDDEEEEHVEDEEEELTPEELETRRLAAEASRQRKLQRRLDKKAALQKRNAELERAYRSKKAFELWRFRSIHGDGCTIFPTWKECSMEILKDKFGKQGNGSELVASSSAAAAAAGTITSSLSVPGASNVEDPVPPPASSSEAIPPVTATTQTDEELARSLAAATETIDDDMPLAKRRRTTRRAAAAGTGNEPVFYGGHTSMSRDQLLDTLTRLLHQAKPGSSSLMAMKNLIFPDNHESSRGSNVDMKKLRSALGYLVYRLGRICRLVVDVEKGDAVCLSLLKDGPLVKFINNDADGGDATGADAAVSNALTLKSEVGVVLEEMVSDVANANNVDGAPEAVDPVASSIVPPPAAPAMDEFLKTRLSALEGYISSLHHTELSLRKSLMKVIDKGYGSKGCNETLLQISTVAISTAADETSGMADAEDWKYFLPKNAMEAENGNNVDNGSGGEEVKWSTSSNAHALIGQVLYRPQFSPLRPSQEEEGAPENDAADLANAKCHWYRIVAYTPSVKDVEDVTTSGASNSMPSSNTVIKDAPCENTIVQRRMRFRAVPVAESDIDMSYHRMDDDEDEDDDIEYMVLTEGQARAGVEAAMLHRTIENKSKAALKKEESSDMSQSALPGRHPFRNRHGSRVMLTPQSEDGEDFSKDILYGIIAGYDIAQSSDNLKDGAVKNKVLVLLEEEDESAQEGEEVDVGKDKKPGVAFWSTVVDAPEGTFITDIVPVGTTDESLSSTFRIEMHEFHQGSEAYNACAAVVTYLKNNSKAAPFMFPVDFVALGIPDYATVITEPMDITTLGKNLEDGKYSRIPTKTDDENDEDEQYDHPVYRMLYGPFYQATMLIFDNCIKYNGETSWIGNEAVIFKKNTIKKMQQLWSKAHWQGQGGETSARSSRGAAKKSVYAEEDSDIDMYEYESDYDDTEGGKRQSRKGKRSKKSKKKQGKDDISSKAIEQPFMVPENAHEFGNGLGAFPHLKIQTNVGKFAFSQDWSCRYVKEGSSNEGEADDDEEAKEEDETLFLMELQQRELEDAGTVRRSTRERHAPQNYADEDAFSSGIAAVSSTPQTPVTLPGVEYYLINNELLQSKKEEDGELSNDADSSIPTACRSRLGIEGVQETIHEQFYAKLYRDHSPNAMILDSDIGKYADGSFPPYLGRVMPSTSGSDDADGIVWEIREQYLIPALRWILRGLVRSGHLQEVDGSLSEGALDDAPQRTSFGAGIVVPSHEYYYNETSSPFDVLDEKEILRKRRQNAAEDGGSSSEEEVELSEYEQMRAARVQRNAERLRALGLL